MGNLKRAQQTLGEQFVRGHPGDVFARHGDAATGWRQAARDDIEKSGFSGTIRPDQAGDGPGFDPERCAINSPKAAEMPGKVFDFDHDVPLSRPPLVTSSGAGGFSL
jgi:hypothetical protein